MGCPSKKYIRSTVTSLPRTFPTSVSRTRITRMATRQSRRLRGEEPDIPPSFLCFVCQDTEFTCANSVERLPCYHNFVHKRCQRRWMTRPNQSTCGLCRQPLQLQRAARVHIMRVPVSAMTRQEIIDRLQQLINSDDLQRHIEVVSFFFFL